MVSRKGFEPLTYGLGNRCSILLSYRDGRTSETRWRVGRAIPPNGGPHSMFRDGVQQEGRSSGRRTWRGGGLVFALVLAAATTARATEPDCVSLEGEPVWAARAVRGDEIVLTDGRRVRLAGVEAPRPPLVPRSNEEAREAEAADRAARVALAEAVEGREVALSEIGRDRHGRLLGHLYDTDGGHWIEARLVAAGHLRVLAGAARPDCVRRLLAEEADARRDRRGLWGTAAFAVLPAATEATASRVGRRVVVEGRVRSVGRSTGRVWLNFGDDFRRDFALVMRDKDLDRFRAAGFDPTAARGWIVRVRGVVFQADGPRIAVEAPEDIERVTR